MRTPRLIATGMAAGALLLVPACNDEDGDGGVTDEEVEDLEQTGDSVEDEIQEEIDAQDEGSNEG